MGKQAVQRSILFLPGLNCTAALFKPQIEALENDFSCSVGNNGSHDTMGAIVRGILDQAPERFVVVGLSMGGYLALEIMRQQPERVLGMILLDTRCTPDTAEDAERRRRTIEIVERGQFDILHSILWPRLVHPNRIADKTLEAIVKKMMKDTGKERFIRQQTAILNRVDYEPLLPEIKVPVLVGVGREDLITPPEMGELIASKAPVSELKIFDDCGHLSTLEKPELVTFAIKSFLNEKRVLNL